MSRLGAIVLTVFATAFGAAACDLVTGGDDSLTETEARALFLGMRTLVFALDTAQAVVPQTDDRVVVACPRGGEWQGDVDASFTSAGDTVRVETNVTLRPTDCGFAHGGIDFVVNGELRDMTSIWFLDGGDFSLPVRVGSSVVGNLAWTVEDRSGSCAIDLALEGTVEVETELNGAYVGTLCGMAVEIDQDDLSSLIPSGTGAGTAGSWGAGGAAV